MPRRTVVLVIESRATDAPAGSDAVRPGTLRVFYSYAHRDEPLRAALQAHLSPLRRERILMDWWDRQIRPGAAWDTEIAAQLTSSHIVIVLLSAYFIASDYAYGKELATALEMHREGRLTVVPVIARPCHWRDLPIGQLQALPANGRAVTRWRDRDSAYVSVVEGIERIAQDQLAARHTLMEDWLTSRLLRRRVIRAVQEALVQRQLYDGPIDGDPGPLTERAVRQLQRQGGVHVDGRIGPDVISLVTTQAEASQEGRRTRRSR
jgi:hypothetical protein